MIRQFELVERVQSYDPDADEEMLNRAYVYGLKKHGTQLRASGDPYFSHPVEVAGILAEMKLDASSIVTGLLHDTIEDTDATRDEIGSPDTMLSHRSLHRLAIDAAEAHGERGELFQPRIEQAHAAAKGSPLHVVVRGGDLNQTLQEQREVRLRDEP